MTPKITGSGNITLPITAPWTRDFLLPQKTKVIMSSLEKLKNLETTYIKPIIKKKKPNINIPSQINSPALCPSNMFSAKDSAKAVKTINNIMA